MQLSDHTEEKKRTAVALAVSGMVAYLCLEYTTVKEDEV